MSNTRRSRIIAIGMGFALVLAAGLTWATPGSGTQSMLLGRATFEEAFKVKREAGTIDWEVEVEAKPALDVAIQMITFQPGGHSGWHSHPGPVFISVVAGKMTFYEADDPNCAPVVRQAGQGFLDTGEHAHIARNETTAPATNVVTYFVPPGSPLRTDAPYPGNCPF
jgi:Cupin domain